MASWHPPVTGSGYRVFIFATRYRFRIILGLGEGRLHISPGDDRLFVLIQNGVDVEVVFLPIGPGPRDFLFLFWFLGLAIEEVLKGGDLFASVLMNLEHIGAGGGRVRLFEGGGDPTFDGFAGAVLEEGLGRAVLGIPAEVGHVSPLV